MNKRPRTTYEFTEVSGRDKGARVPTCNATCYQSRCFVSIRVGRVMQTLHSEHFLIIYLNSFHSARSSAFENCFSSCFWFSPCLLGGFLGENYRLESPEGKGGSVLSLNSHPIGLERLPWRPGLSLKQPLWTKKA